MVTDKEERDRTGGARSPASSAMMKMGRMQRWLLLHPRPAGFSLSLWIPFFLMNQLGADGCIIGQEKRCV
jgi:hypothetical protein